MLFNLSGSFCELCIHFLCSVFYWVLKNHYGLSLAGEQSLTDFDNDI